MRPRHAVLRLTEDADPATQGFAAAADAHELLLTVFDPSNRGPQPFGKQRIEAMNKRRIGLGFTALGNALAFLCTKYNSHEGRAKAAEISEFMRECVNCGAT